MNPSGWLFIGGLIVILSLSYQWLVFLSSFQIWVASVNSLYKMNAGRARKTWKDGESIYSVQRVSLKVEYDAVMYNRCWFNFDFPSGVCFARMLSNVETKPDPLLPS